MFPLSSIHRKNNIFLRIDNGKFTVTKSVISRYPFHVTTIELKVCQVQTASNHLDDVPTTLYTEKTILPIPFTLNGI